MSEWKPDPRTEKLIGPYVMISERSNQTAGSAHSVALPDGRRLRVLPDGTNTGLRRSRGLSEALREASELEAPEKTRLLVILGYLDQAGLEWCWAELEEDALSEWLQGWWLRMTREGEPQPWHRLKTDLARAGWTIEPRSDT